MQIIKGTINAVKDTQTAVAIDTGLGVLDQKTLWELTAIEWFWESGFTVPGTATGYFIQGVLSRKTDKFGFNDSEVISTVNWSAHGGGGDATSFQEYDSVQRDLFLEKPWVANSQIFFIANNYALVDHTLKFKLYYDEKKVTEVEFLKAQSGYCIC